MKHELRIEPNYLENLLNGRKKCEIRINDRDYQCGDTLEFKSYSGIDTVYTHLFLITHIHSGLGLERNYVALSVREVSDELG